MRAPMASSMHKWFATGLLLLVALAVSGCRQDMQDQPRYIPLRGSTFFKDGQSSRQPAANTVARGQLRANEFLYTGKINGQPADGLPDGLLRPGFGMKELLARGRDRYSIYCTPCHSSLGDGRGVAAQRGFNKMPANYHEDRLKKVPLGYFVDVMTSGFGAMQSYNMQLTAEDRWAVAAYIRALQLSQAATIADVPESERSKIQPPKTAPMGVEARPESSQPQGKTPEKGEKR